MVLLRPLLRMALVASAVTAAASARADDGVSIADTRQDKWQVVGDRVYLRNLNSFDPTFLPCCYNYYIDISNDAGRAMLAAFLTSYASGLNLTIYVTNKTIIGPVTHLGPV